LLLSDTTIHVKDLKYLVAKQVNLAAKRVIINFQTDSVSVMIG
jgi:hypothetical protein